MAAPERPAINAWLSLVGMPNFHAAVAQITMASSAAHNATVASCVLPPKSTMLYMVIATLELTIVITSTPRKLNMAAMMIAALGLMAPGGNAGGDGVGGIRPAVDEYDAQRQ